MKPRRPLAASLTALLALLCPGPQAWAALAKVAAPISVHCLPLGQMGAHAGPVSGSMGALSSDIKFVLTPTVGFTAPKVHIQEGIVQAPAPLPTPVSAPSTFIPARTPSIPAVAAKAGTLTSLSAPILEAVSAKNTSPSAMRQGGAELQKVLEASLSQPSDSSSEAVAPLSQPASVSPSALKSASQAGENAPASLPRPELAPKQKSEFHFYSAAVSAVKIGIEGLNLAVPLLLLNTLHAAMAVSTLYLAAELASIFAGLAGGALVDMIGARRALVLTGFVQAAAIIGVPLAILSGGAMAMPLVYGLFIINGVAGELFDVARRSVMPQIVGQDEGLLRKYNGKLYVWREIAATAGVFGAGWLVHHVGAMAAIWMHPAFCIAAAFAALRLLRAGKAEAPAGPAAAALESQARLGVKATLTTWWADIVNGAKYVLAEKKLRTIVLINIPLNALHKIFHTLIAVVYALQVLHSPAMAAVLLGAWNLGELAGAYYLQRWGRTSRFSNWMRLAAVASLALWGFWLVPSAWVAIPVSFLLAAAMIGNELGTASYMQSTVPSKELGAVTGFIYGFARAVGMIALLLTGLSFNALGPMGGFLALAVIFTVCAPIYLYASRRFTTDKLEAPANLPQD